MPFRLACRVLAAIAVVLLVLGGLFFWRLSAGPITLDFLARPLESALSRPDQGYFIRFEGLELRTEQGLAFHVRDARMIAPNGSVLASSPGVRLGISRSALLRGILAPSSIDLAGVRVRLYRKLDGSIRFTLAEITSNRAAPDSAPAELDASDFLRMPDPDKATGYLQRLRVSDGTVTLFDERSGTTWSAPGSNFSISREDAQITAGLGTTLEAPGGQQRLDASGGLDLASGEAWLDLKITGLRLVRLAPLVPALERARALDMAFDATASARFNPDGSVRQGRFQISGRDGSLTIGDEKIPIATIRTGGLLQKGGDILTLEEISVAAGDISVDGRATFGFEEDGVRIDGRIANLNPAGLSGLSPALASVGKISLPLQGDFSGKLDATGALERFNVDLQGEDGQLTIDEAVPVTRLAISGAVDGTSGSILVSRLFLDLNDATIEASGQAAPTGAGWKVDAKALARNVPVNKLDQLWPHGLAKGGREWVTENISDGTVDEARLTLSTVLDGEASAEKETVSGSLSFSGASVRYWKPLPKFDKVSGQGKFAGRTFDVSLNSGELGNIGLREGRVLLTGLGLEPGKERADIDVTFAGPLSEIFAVLNKPPLEYAKWLDVDPAEVGGSAVATLSVELPLLDDLELDQLTIGAKADLRKVSLPEIAFGNGIDAADLLLDIDKKGLRLSGNGRFAGMQTSLDVTHRFEGNDPGSLVKLSGVVTDEVLSALDLDLAPYVAGSAPLRLTLTGGDGGTSVVDAEVDLSATALSLSRAGWSKPSGSPGIARARLQLEGERLVAIESFELNAGSAYTRGSGTLNDAGTGLRRLAMDRVRLGDRTDLSAQVEFAADGAKLVRLSGKTLDLSPLLKGGGESGGATATETRQSGDRLALDARLDQVWIGARSPLTAVDGHLRLVGETLQNGEMRGNVGEGNGIYVVVAESAEERELHLTLDDAGAAMQTLGWFDSLSGGKLTITASRPIRPQGPGWRGKAESDGFRLSDTPLAARFLAATSLKGLADLSSKDAGISFDKLEAPFTFQDDRLKLEPGRIYGSALGITFSGSVNLDTDDLDIVGTIVPAYAVNSFLGSIPILGDLLTGGEGSGVFAATYRASGSIDEPNFSVNPLAALAPGFLRRLFGEIADGGVAQPDNGWQDPAVENSFPGNRN